MAYILCRAYRLFRLIGCLGAAAALAVIEISPGVAAAAESRDMVLTGFHDLQGRGAYQPVIQEQDGRWIAYVGHQAGSALNPLTGKREDNGTSVIDVSDPARPLLLHHIPGPPGGGAQMVRVCSGRELPRAGRSRIYLLRSRGHDAHELWDVTLSAPPKRIGVIIEGLHGTHKNWWECDTGIAYLVSGVPGWRTSRMTQIYDLGDPRRPRFIRNYGLPGQEPGASGPVPTGLHGAISTGPQGGRVYFGHGTSSGGILQIVDRAKLLQEVEPTRASLLAPQLGRYDLDPDYGAHTAFPLTGMAVKDAGGRTVRRDFVAVTNEALAEGCGGAQQKVWFIDVSDEAQPRVASTWALDARGGGWCDRPGRVGAHASNESFALVYYRRILFIAHFNAGVRALDIRDPYRLREIAHYVPDGGGRTVTTNNVEVDDRGYIYIVDRHGLGMHVLELTGAARGIAKLP